MYVLNFSLFIYFFFNFGKIFTSTAAWKPKNLIFFSKKFEIEFCLSLRVSVPREKNHLSFVNISPTLVIDTSMERSSRVLQHENIKICFFFFKLKLYFDLCQRAEIIQVGLNMYLYVDIGDASSSFRGSTSSNDNNIAFVSIESHCPCLIAGSSSIATTSAPPFGGFLSSSSSTASTTTTAAATGGCLLCTLLCDSFHFTHWLVESELNVHFLYLIIN